MGKHTADLALAASFGGGGGLATLALMEATDDLSSAAVGFGFGAGLLLGLAPWRRLRRRLDPRLARRPANWRRLGLAAGFVFVCVFTVQCELLDSSAPEALPHLPEAMAAGLLGLWSAFFLSVAAPLRGSAADSGAETGSAPTPAGATLGLGAAFGFGCFLAMGSWTLIYGGTPGWGEVRNAAGLGAGLLLGFPVWRWAGRRLSPLPGAWRSAVPSLVAGVVTVVSLVGWAQFQGPFFGPAAWYDGLLAHVIQGVWNACLLGIGFGHLIPDGRADPGP